MTIMTFVPSEWATVDRCLDWLRPTGWSWGDATEVWMGGDTTRPGWAVVLFHVDGRDVCGERGTLHAALIAACQAVQEATP